MKTKLLIKLFILWTALSIGSCIFYYTSDSKDLAQLVSAVFFQFIAFLSVYAQALFGVIDGEDFE